MGYKRSKHTAAALLIAALPESTRLRAVALRQDRNWTYGDLPPSFAFQHAANEMALGYSRECRRYKLPAALADVVMARAKMFARLALERAALDGDENALGVLKDFPVPPIDGETRRKLAEDIDGALARVGGCAGARDAEAP